MKKVIGIYCGERAGYNWDEDYIIQNGGGGSETWAAQISQEFQRMGFHVIVFCETENWHFVNSGVEYVPYQLFEFRCQYQPFDYFISSRQTKEITHNLSCPNVYVMNHDISLHFTEHDSSSLKLDRVKKYAFLSSWQEWAYSEWYNYKFNDDQKFRTFNGVDFSFYNNEVVKKNKMVWSTCSERGLNWFLNNVYLKIKREVPDFEIDVCLYTTDLNQVSFENYEGLNFIGKVGKQELARRQMESKIWIYPNLGYYDTDGTYCHETFCITAIENGAAKNAILTNEIGGLKDTLKNYGFFLGEGLYDKNDLGGGIYGEENLNNYATQLAYGAIKILKDDAYREELANKAFTNAQKYTWHNSAMTWIKEWGLHFD